MLIITGISGGGKSTVTQLLKAKHTGLSSAVTATTRSPRDGEVFGIDYYFVSEAIFRWMEATNQLLEHAHVYEYFYGVPKGPVEMLLAQNHNVIITIDVKGAQSLLALFPEAKIIFLTSPSSDIQKERLQARGTKDSALALRLHEADNELAWAKAHNIPIITSHTPEQTLLEAETLLIN